MLTKPSQDADKIGQWSTEKNTYRGSIRSTGIQYIQVVLAKTTVNKKKVYKVYMLYIMFF